ncbi:TonB-dependent receptor [Labilibacter marinus]|uniref:TonB-dependent receptor n=1 Tax=Labilibacter marinus TaxID=1477105 RepID=UPI00082ACE77|nr:TonB-dependent receptor [Labilibacter marinus]
MLKTSKPFILLFISLLFLHLPNIYGNVLFDKDEVVLSGHVKDAASGELLIGATIYFEELKTGTISNLYGFYSYSVTPGSYQVKVVYLGYQTIEKTVDISANTTLNFELSEETESINEVVVTSEKIDAHVRDAQMSVQKLQSKDIKAIPALMGEVDVIKVLQLMPGVQATSEGSSGFSVRGGNPDQNLILLDEATVYNAGHMLGFFSVFNNDAVKDVKLYKGDIPAEYGGRLASLVDVRMKDGNKKKFSGTGGIGLISSRLTLEGPIIEDRTSFIVSGRRTYADLFLPLSSDESIRDNKLYFYDINAKLNHEINNNNRVYLSMYMGRDVFKEEFSKMDFGNKTYTARWNHVYNPKLFSNLTFVHSNYDYSLGTNEESSGFKWVSKLQDYSLKLDYNYYLNPNITLDFGVQSIFHKIKPGTANGTGEDPVYDKVEVPDAHALEHAAYVGNTHKLGSRMTLKYGLRFTAFQNIGPGTFYEFDEDYEPVEEKKYESGDIFNTYAGIEPRVAMAYMLNESSSVKGSYSRTRQYMHLASNSTSGTPLDVWFLSSPNIKPQISDQFSVGYFKNMFGNSIETSVELFYKDMQNTIDFKDHPQLLLNDKLEGELRVGKSWAYGAEFLVKLKREDYSGWVSYTYSKSYRKIPGIVNGEAYLSPYNHDHDIAIVLNRKLGKRGQLSMNWVYTSGAPFTKPVGRMHVGGDVIPIYSSRNEAKMPDYHRMDVSYTLKGKNKKMRRWEGEWNFSVYNIYGRKNAWSIYYDQGDENSNIITPKKTYLFQFIPSVTYNFKF